MSHAVSIRTPVRGTALKSVTLTKELLKCTTNTVRNHRNEIKGTQPNKRRVGHVVCPMKYRWKHRSVMEYTHSTEDPLEIKHSSDHSKQF